ncbi:class I SAM-dependent methyltransferase [Desulfosarcina sp.]|uniref:class I SAM-dependent methyltransferase n=1 Tax=Desulfosarcina sp. TaxID=2027861 RepID=UPI0029A21C3B|nr:class I SAM-dependent methyltransferase [Desulfosarcina sp.]MDX2455240.1 class I SAM-dependent methyltransferase [Desulfosarcina sp.]MDX2492775.1 class I SAM-dependent methyltransferase [Desulfosarcina sp.]
MRHFFYRLSGQLSHPRGIAGRIIAFLMNHTNAKMYGMAFDLLDVQPRDRLLEIGFGNGKYLRRALMLAPGGRVAGIDWSGTMVQSARRRNRPFVDSGRIEIQKAGVDLIPYPDRLFDKVFTLNTLYFWQAPEKAFHEIHRVLKPGGVLVLGMNTRKAMEKSHYDRRYFTFYHQEEVERLLNECGFGNVLHVYDKMAVEDALCFRARARDSGADRCLASDRPITPPPTGNQSV